MRKIKNTIENFQAVRNECIEYAHTSVNDMDNSIDLSLEAEHSRNFAQLVKTEVFALAVGDLVSINDDEVVVSTEDDE